MTEIRPAVDWFPDFCSTSGLCISADDPRPGIETWHPEFLREGPDGLETFMVPTNSYQERTWFQCVDECMGWLRFQRGNSPVVQHHVERGPVHVSITMINSDGDPFVDSFLLSELE